MQIIVDDQGVWQIGLPDRSALAANVLLQDDTGAVFIPYRENRRYQGAGISLDAQFDPVLEGIEVTLCLHANEGRQIGFVGLEFGPLHLTDRHRFFGTTSGFLEKSGVVSALTAQSEGRSANLVGVVANPEGMSLLAGIGAPHADPSCFSLVSDRLRAGFKPERKLTGNHEFKLFIGFKRDPLELLGDYGRRLAPQGRCGCAVPTGWNSWDFYGGAIRMEDIDGEIAALDRLAFRDRLQYLTIDMGWEEMWGNWIPNRKFPAAMHELAGRIRTAGWRPGIWIAPLLVSLFTPLARYRPELFLRNAEGGLIIEEEAPCGPALLLDFSLPEVGDLVGGWFRAMRQAGFELFKIDYIYEKYLCLARHNAGGLGKIAFARSLFQTLRGAVGHEAHIVNCGASKEAALGLVDSSRVTVDIHNFWGHIRNNALQLAHAFWMNRQLWINDPDFAIVRHRANCAARHKNMPYTLRPLISHSPSAPPSEFWMRGPEASPDEMRLWLSVVRLNGGSLFLSDSIQTLTSEGRSELGRLFPPLETSFVPLDLFEREWPGIWLSKNSQRPTLGLFNWEDRPQALALPTLFSGGFTARDFWSGRPVRLSGAAELGPRSGLLLDI